MNDGGDRQHRAPRRLTATGWDLFRGMFPEDLRNRALSWIVAASRSETPSASLEPEYEFEQGAPVRKLRRLLWSEPEFWAPLLGEAGVFRLASEYVHMPALVFHAAFLKPRSLGSPVGYHQDQALWTFDYPGAVSLWIALTDARLENGCLHVFSGSQLKKHLPHEPDPAHPWHPVISARCLPEEQPTAIEMRAGDGLLWDRYLVHGSGPNRSLADRVGMVLVFADSSAPGFRAKDQYRLT